MMSQCLQCFSSKLPPDSEKHNCVWLLTIISTDNHVLTKDQSSALVAQLGRVADNLEYCSVPCRGFDFWSRILSAEHKKTSYRDMGYRVCQLILPITTY